MPVLWHIIAMGGSITDQNAIAVIASNYHRQKKFPDGNLQDIVKNLLAIVADS